MNTPKSIPHQLTEHTKLLQKVALVSDNKVLVLQRSEEANSRPGCWDLPGGNSEWPAVKKNQHGLHTHDAVREVNEETGISLEENVFGLNSLVYFNSYFNVEKQIFTIIANWWVELPNNFPEDVIELSDEHTKYAWIHEEDLTEYDFGGKAGEFVVETIQTALACSQAIKEMDKSESCCGGGCCGGDGHHSAN